MSLFYTTSSSAQEPAPTLTASLPTEEQRSPAAAFEISLAPTPDDAAIVRLTIEATIAEKWHIYPSKNAGMNTPTEIKFEPVGLEPVGETFELKHNDPGKKLKGTFKWTRDYKVSKDATSFSGTGSIRFQACDATKCLPPKTLTFELGSANIATAKTGTAKSKAEPVDADNDVIELKTQACSTTRPPAKFNMSSMFSGRSNDRLNRKCSIEVDGQMIDIYLPKEKEYTVENSGTDNTMISNTSTFISIDQNGDGVLESHESMPTNLPIRILDSMYVATGIADDASSITLTKFDGPLSGVVLNRKCPEFSFQTVDGDRTISDKSILGKVTLLDIWAVT